MVSSVQTVIGTFDNGHAQVQRVAHGIDTLAFLQSLVTEIQVRRIRTVTAQQGEVVDHIDV